VSNLPQRRARVATPSPVSVGVDSKRFNNAISPLVATLAGNLASVDSKRVKLIGRECAEL
jgi:hypothetical protein